jgi:AraC-like DNA-binding protein
MALGRAKLAMAQGISVWVLEAPGGFGDAGFHAHHAIQLTVSLSGTLSLQSESEELRAPAIAVAADARHRFAAEGLLAFVFVEPESRAGRALALRLFGDAPLAAIDPALLPPALDELRHAFEPGLTAADLQRAGEALVEALAPPGAAAPPDPRVRRIIDHSIGHHDEPLSLASAAHGVYLSPSRLRHLFVEQTGLPYKTYVLWLRLVRALEVYSQGRSLTEAAHAAGFADSAHFSRVFKRTFGLPATTLTRL